MSDQQKRSRKSVLRMAGFQGRIFLFIVLAGCVSMTLNGYLFYSYVADSYDFILRHSSLPQEVTDDRQRELFVLWISLTLISMLIILIIAIWALFLTHRATGPVYHVRRVIDEIRSGNRAARVRLRKKDEFQELASSFNSLMDELGQR
jgi:nitrogen fixation/metabolism regulation signal transduction histidine kinase